MSRSRLLLIFGGRSSEHDVSLRSATEVLAAVDPQRFETILLGIHRDGRFCHGPTQAGIEATLCAGTILDDPLALLHSCDVVFPLLHGPYGEDGSLQGMLEVLGLPYVGSGVLASALCMDKAAFKHHLSAPPHPIPVVPGTVVDLHLEAIDAAFVRVLAFVHETLQFPCFIKPANQGSSVGVSRASDPEQLRGALELAARYDSIILVEQAIDAREIELAVLGDGGPETVVSHAGEISLPEGLWYDFTNKYEGDVATLSLPADLTPETLHTLQALALRAFRATRCHGLARVDFFLDKKTGAPYLNEINTLPGFTSISMYPKLMRHAGVPYTELITRLCRLARQRHQQRNALDSPHRS